MADIYNIGMRIALTDGVSGALALIAGRLLGIHGHVKDIEKGFANWNKALIGLAAGGGILITMKGLVDSAKALSKEVATTMTFNLSAQQQLEVTRETQRVSTGAVRGVSQSGARGIYNRSFALMGHDHSVEMVEQLARAAKVIGGITGDRDKALEELTSVVKSAELMGKLSDPKTGALDKAKFTDFLSLITQYSNMFHGILSPRQVYNLAQQGGPGLKGLSNEGLGSVLTSVIDMGGHRAGTAIASEYSQFFGGVMTKPKAEELQKLGILKKFYSRKGGGVDIPEDGWNEQFRDLLRKDPLAFTKELVQAMKDHGIDDDGKMQEELFKVFSRITTTRLFSDLMSNLEQKVLERTRVMGSQGTADMEKTRDEHDIGQAEYNFTQSWKNLKESIAGPQAEGFISTLNTISDSFNSLAKSLNSLNESHPEVIKGVALGLAGLGALLTAGGAVALFGALGPAGWVIGGFVALGAAFVAFRKDFLDSEFAKILGQEFTAIAAVFTTFGSFLKGWWDQFRDFMVSNGFWGKGKGPTAPPGGGSYDAMGNYTPSAYHPGGAGGDIQSSPIYQGVKQALIDVIYGGEGGGGSGGGSGIMNASFSPDNDNGFGGGAVQRAIRGGGNAGLAHAASRGGWAGYGTSSFSSKADLVNYIRESAIRHGVDPDTAVRVAQSEGLSTYVGDHGTSFGPYQLHYGGSGIRGMNSGGLGDVFTRLHHKDARDRSTVKDQIDFALGYAKSHGWRDWHGAARVGIGRYQGLSGTPRRDITSVPLPPKRAQKPPPVTFEAHLDGHVLARSATHRQAEMAMFPTSSGDIDPYHHYHEAGQRFADVG